jgi:hypothetical protein
MQEVLPVERLVRDAKRSESGVKQSFDEVNSRIHRIFFPDNLKKAIVM